MAYEDLTTYTEVDGGGDLTVTSTKCDVVTMDRNVTNYLYKDYTVGHFGDFEHLFDFNLSVSQDGGQGILHGLYNEYNEFRYFEANLKEGFVTLLYDDNVSGVRIIIREVSLANQDFHQVISYATDYFLTKERSGTTLTLKIYSDSARTTLIDTLTITVTATTFRYLHACMSYNDGNTGRAITYHSENYDLQEAAVTSKKIPDYYNSKFIS